MLAEEPSTTTNAICAICVQLHVCNASISTHSMNERTDERWKTIVLHKTGSPIFTCRKPRLTTSAVN